MKIKFHYSLLFILIVFLFTGYIKEIFIFLSIIIIHELAHLSICLLYKQKITKLNITLVGGILDVELTEIKFFRQLLIYIAGITVNLIILLLSSLIKNPYYQKLIYNYNLLLIVFNLLPIYPLDGYKIIEVFVSLFNDPFKEQRILSFISFSSITLLSIFTIIYVNNFTFWLIISFLIFQNMILSTNKRNIVLQKIVKRYHYT